MVISPNRIVTIYSFDTEISIKVLPFWVTAARLVGKVSAASVKALKNSVLIVELVGNVPVESVKALPVWVTIVRLNGKVPAESVKALPVWVTTVELIGDVPEVSVKALPASVTTITGNFSGLDVLACASAIRINEERSIKKSDPNQPAPPPLKRRKIDDADPKNFTNYTASDYALANSYTALKQPVPFSFFDGQNERPSYKPFYPKQMTKG